MQKIALITGGSRGLGKETALLLASKGISPVITFNESQKEAREICRQLEKEGITSACLKLDLSEFSSLDVFVADFKTVLKEKFNTEKFDYLVHNGGIGASKSLHETDEALFDRLLNIHFKSVYFLSQKLLPHINRNGSVVFISSASTRFCVKGFSAYAAMKGAVEVLSKYVAKEYGAVGIRSNIVAPGATETDFNQGFLKNSTEYQTLIRNNTALGRTAKPDDIAGVIAFLCSEDSRWVNAQRIEVTGGSFL